MDIVIQQLKLADIVQKIVANVQRMTIVGMVIVMDLENHVVHALVIAAIVCQQTFVGMAPVVLEKIVFLVLMIVEHAQQRAHPLINMGLCQEANVL